MENICPFHCFKDEIFKHSVLKCKTSVKQEGKEASIDIMDNELGWFFKIDGGYLSKSKKVDYLFFYYHYGKKLTYILLIELKGRNIKKAVSQIESSLNTPKLKKLLSSCKNNANLKAVIVIGGATHTHKGDCRKINQKQS